MPRNTAESSEMQQFAAPTREENARSEPKPLSPRQRMAARLLTRGMSLSAAARELGLDRGTIARWQSSPQFVAEVSQLIGGSSPSESATSQTTSPSPKNRKANQDPPREVSRPAFVFEGVQYATAQEYLAAINAVCPPPYAEALDWDPFACETDDPADNPPPIRNSRSVKRR